MANPPRSALTTRTNVFLCLLIILAISPEVYPQLVTLPTDWSVGQTIYIERTRVEGRFDGDLKRYEAKTSTRITLKVILKDDDGYVMRWTNGRTVYTDPIYANSPFRGVLANFIQDLPLDIRTDNHGIPQHVENRETVIEEIKKRIENISQQLDDKGADDEAIRRTVAAVEPMTDPETLDPLILLEPKIIMRMQGASLVVNEPHRDTGEISNPFGGVGLPAHIQYVLTQTDPVSRTATIEWRKTLDEKAAAAILRAMFHKSAQKSGKHLSPQEVPRPKIEESTTYLMDTRSGWPRQVSQQRITLNGTLRGQEQLKFEVLLGP